MGRLVGLLFAVLLGVIAYLMLRNGTNDQAQSTGLYGRKNIAAPLNCTPKSDNALFDLSKSNWDVDIFYCNFSVRAKGFLYLSLQGHQRSRDGQSCSFGIYVNGKPINTAPRNYPSHTYATIWHPSFMSDTVPVLKGNHVISLRAQGSACSIHDPDINGFFISSEL